MDTVDRKIAAARLSVYSNTSLVLAKLVVGVLMMSVGVLSEALHSSIDLVAALIARYSVKKSEEPADRRHSFGHGKYENLSGMVEGALIFVAAVAIIYEAARRFADPVGIEFVGIGMAVMGGSAVVNWLVSRRLMTVAKETDSLALEADACHLKTDVWTSVGVFAALGLILVTGEELLDPMIALVVAAFIIKAAWDITRRSASGLLDETLPPHEIRAVEEIINRHRSEFVDFHRLRARKSGPERQLDLHVTVPHSLSVKDSHTLADRLEREIRKALPRTTALIHIEPCDEDCEKCRIHEGDDSSRDRCREGRE